MKIYLKVVKDRRMAQVYFCTVPDEIYEAFDALVHLDTLDFNAYLSVWAAEDFMAELSMSCANNITQLRKIIINHYKRDYPELYTLEKVGIRIDDDFWIKYWTVNHMRMEGYNV